MYNLCNNIEDKRKVCYFYFWKNFDRFFQMKIAHFCVKESGFMKQILFNVSRGIAILFVAGLAMMIVASQWGLMVLKEPVDFEMLLEQEPEKGMHVKGDVIFAYDCFATEDGYTERSDGKMVKIEKGYEYYILPAEGEVPFVVLQSFAADSKKMSTLADETWDYMYGGAEPTTRVAVEGCVGELDPEIKDYMKEYLMEGWEYTEDELAEANILMIQQPKSLSSLISIFWIGVVCVLIAVLWFVMKMVRYSKNKKVV